MRRSPIEYDSVASIQHAVKIYYENASVGPVPRSVPVAIVQPNARNSGAGVKKIILAGAATDRGRAQSSRERVIQRSRDLTDRQRQIVTLVCAGCPNKLIARKLRVGEGTVKTHLHAIFLRLGVENRADLIDALGNAQSSKPPRNFSDKAKNRERT
jgi:DNA-binding NarL/FixJ family response regulator